MHVLGVIGKIVLVILIIAVLLIVGLLISLNYIKGALSEQHKSSQTVLKAGTGAKRALVIYQPSRSDVTKNYAMQLANEINKKGYEVTINYPGEFIDSSLTEYDIVVFGTPVYMGKTSSVLDKYISGVKSFNGKSVVYFETGMVKPEAADADTMKNKISGADKVFTAKFVSDKNNTDKENAALIKELVDKLCV